MGIAMNMDGTNAWNGSSILGPGEHLIQVVDAEETVSNNQEPQFLLQMKALSGPEVGGTIRDYVTVTSKTLGRIKMILEAFGVEIPAGEFNFEPERLKGQVCKIVVREETWNEKTRSKVQGYIAADPADVPQGSTGPVPVGAVPTAGRTDDDIPF